jgi:hypothetical protein
MGLECGIFNIFFFINPPPWHELHERILFKLACFSTWTSTSGGMEKQVGSGLSFFSGMTGRSSMSGGGGDDMGFDVDEMECCRACPKFFCHLVGGLWNQRITDCSTRFYLCASLVILMNPICLNVICHNYHIISS